jgi:drug/metabolite transporter (DMT)-like permease
MYRTQLQWRPIALLLLITMIWGSNMAFVKIASREMAPIFMAGLRSVVASLCLYIWMKARRIKVFPSATVVGHGIVAGILFGSEFGLIFVGLEYTLASRGYVLLYIAPFFAALGAHFFLVGDRLNVWKAVGLLSAFCGVAVLFMKNVSSFSFEALPGDILFLIAGASWGATTVYIKKNLVRLAQPLQILFYQLFFSAPFLLIISMVMEDAMVWSVSFTLVFSLFYQCIIVAFLSYLVWFVLVSRYPVSLMHAFSFFTPVFGVLFSGILILGETISPNLVMALILVSIGMVLVNYQPKPSQSSTNMQD